MVTLNLKSLRKSLCWLVRLREPLRQLSFARVIFDRTGNYQISWFIALTFFTDEAFPYPPDPSTATILKGKGRISFPVWIFQKNLKDPMHLVTAIMANATPAMC